MVIRWWKEVGPSFASKRKSEKNGLYSLVVLSREFSFSWISKNLGRHSFLSTLHDRVAPRIASLAIAD